MQNHNFNFPAIKSELVNLGDDSYKLVIGPLMPGFGYTIGNSLRRIMLSSVPGFAVTKVKINDITHEYQAVEGIKEDALDVVLNLRMLRAKIKTDSESVTLTLKKNEGGKIYASDFADNAAVEILNPDLYICEVVPGKKINIEVEIERGQGYVAYEERNLRGNTDPTSILVDASFSPIKNVSLDVKKVRVGDKTNFDSIQVTFDSDGTVDASEICKYSLDLSVNLFQNILSSFSAELDGKQALKNQEENDTNVEEMDEDLSGLNPRIVKILNKNGISSKKELIERKAEISEFSGLGEKMIKEVEEFLK